MSDSFGPSCFAVRRQARKKKPKDLPQVVQAQKSILYDNLSLPDVRRITHL